MIFFLSCLIHHRESRKHTRKTLESRKYKKNDTRAETPNSVYLVIASCIVFSASSMHIFIAYLHCISSSHIFLAYLHCISSSHIFIACLHRISSSHIFIAYLHCISLLHFFIAYLHCISCLHIFIAYLHCIYLLQIFIAYLHCISLLHIVIAYLHCISLLYGGRLRFFAVACRSRSLAVFAVACRLRSLALFIEMLHCLRRHRCVPKMAFPEIQKIQKLCRNAYLNAKHYKFQINFFRIYFSPLKFLG